ncbi:MAG: hypothetical protein ABI417_22105 [Coleofasciculaceae cyanobacterium]
MSQSISKYTDESANFSSTAVPTSLPDYTQLPDSDGNSDEPNLVNKLISIN